MKRYYRVYTYTANVRIPNSEHHADKHYTADEVESITLADAYHGDCFLYDDPVLLTEDEAAARTALASLIAKANTTVGREYGTQREILQVTGCGMEILDYNDDLFGEPEDADAIIDCAESRGEEWHFAETAGTNDEE